jgi:tRNA(Ile)-lysidine synthase
MSSHDGRAMARPAVETSDLLPRCAFPSPGEEIVCAVSGGPDSLALLVLATASGCMVTAVHVDHGLRPDSAAEAGFVKAVAQRYGAAFRPERVEVSAGPNLEARARWARRAVLPPDAATGHTMDDQAETVVINLLRGAGLDGLSAMSRGPTHPILGLRRFETRELCASEGLRPLEDPMNHERRFVRNRVRHELLPLCCDIAGRDVVALLARQAELLAEEASLLDALAAQLDPSDAKRLTEAPGPLARRATRRWLRDGGYPPDARAVERVLDVARGTTRATDLAPGTRVRRSGGVLSRARVEALGDEDLQPL